MNDTSHCKIIDISAVKLACSHCTAHQLCLPLGLKLDDMERLEGLIKRRPPLARGQYVFHLGDELRALYAIRSGSVKTYTMTEEGSEQITGFHLSGEIIGLDGINHNLHTCGARTLESTSVCEIPFGQLEELAASVPGLGRQLLRLMSRELYADSESFAMIGKKTAEERVAAFLINLSNRFQERGFSAREFHLNMSRNDIGNYLGLAVETVSRLFTRFQQQGLIEVHKRLICLKNREQLRELAGGGLAQDGALHSSSPNSTA